MRETQKFVRENALETFLLLQFLEVAVLALLGFGRGFYELQKLLERLPLDSGNVEAHANAETRVALNNDSVEDQALHPNFSARNPKTDFDVSSALDRGHSLHVAAAHARVGK